MSLRRNFKDAVAADVSGVFLNPGEFSEEHQLGFGQLNTVKPIVCMIDEDLLDDRGSNRVSESVDGVYMSRKVLFVPVADLDKRPVERENCFLDGDRYKVADCAEDDGIYRITIEANNQ